MFEPLRICLVGATGLTGSALIEQAVGRTDVRIVGVARREAKLPRGARMEMLIAPVDGWADAIAASHAAAMVCALGTTWRKAGKAEAAFRAVDQELVLACARAAKAAGIEHLIVISSAGADPAAKPLYLRVKGEVEEALGKMRFRRLDVLRPGLLRGHRNGDRRIGERLAIIASPVTDLLLHGKYRQYRSVSAENIAIAILALAREKAAGRFVHDHDGIHRAIRRAGG
jgi:uncharacterized protein YbjT (DUF2867 family)